MLSLILIFIALNVGASTFGEYDFTFYKTIDDSVAIMNDERFGFDYTGYGFIGSSMTSGIYIRMGIQTPYTTLLSLFEKSDSDSKDQEAKPDDKPQDNTIQIPSTGNDSVSKPNVDSLVEQNTKSDFSFTPQQTPTLGTETGKDQNSTESDKTQNTIPVPDTSLGQNKDQTSTPDVENNPAVEEIKARQDREFIFSLTIGPAFRHFISDRVMWYMGLGITSIAKNVTSSDTVSNGTIATLEIKLGTDMDTGFRIDLGKKNTSLRIGVHMTTDLLTYSSSSLSGGKLEKPIFSNSLSANVFTPIGEKSATDITGYIGLGHVFKPSDVIRYRYSNSTPILGGGTLIALE